MSDDSSIRTERTVQEVQNLLVSITSLCSGAARDQIDSTINEIIFRLGEFCRADRCWVMGIGQSVATVSHEWCKLGIFSGMQIQDRYSLDGLEWVLKQLHEQPYLVISDLNNIPKEASILRSMCESQLMKGFVAAPIFYAGNLTGLVGYDFIEQSVNFNQTEVSVLIIASEMLANLLHRKRVEVSNKELDLRFRTVLDNLSEGVVIGDLDDRILYCNHRYSEIVGYSASELIGKQAYNFLVPIEDQYKILEGTSRRLSNLSDEYEVNLIHKDGRRIDVLIKACPYRNTEGQVIGNISAHTDITARKSMDIENERLHRQLAQVQKMEAVGQLAAGLAHDLNNNLTAIMGHLNLIKLQTEGEVVINESADSALLGCKRSSEIIQQLLSFSSSQALKSTREDLRSIVNESIELTRGMLASRITIRQSGAMNEVLVSVDRGLIVQVLTNLLINASHAMPSGGTIGFSFSSTYLDRVSHLNKLASPGSFCVLTISDTGSGIQEEVISRIFEPFYSTKQGKGSGLGLSMAYAAMQRHGGWIEVDSDFGNGTSFSLYFPDLENMASVTSIEKFILPTENKVQPLGTILVIDDEPVLAELACSFLSRAGFKTVSFSKAKEAFPWYEYHYSEVTLVLLDMRMPDFSAAEIFQKLKEINPDSQIVLISGFVDDADVANLLSKGAISFIQKPIKYSELVDWILKTVRISKSSQLATPLYH